MYRLLPRVVILAQGVFFFALNSNAQILDLPRESPKAQVSQRIGVTDIALQYSRPVVKGRKVWGAVVPLGDVWRAGANENTTIEFSDAVTVEGKPLPKGVYGLHMIPKENEWTVIFSKNSTSWGSYTYNPAEDALRVTVKPQPAEFREALTYEFDNLKPDSATVALRWEKIAVPFKVDVNTNEIVQASMQRQLRNWQKWSWQGWDEAANYLLSQKLALNDALKYSDGSIQLEERFDNLMTKANVLDALGRKNDAAPVRTKAIAMGSVLQLHSYGRQLQSQGKQDQAFEIFRTNIKKNPNHWVVHSEVARMACAKSRFDEAAKEMKLAAAGAPAQYKPGFEKLAQRLEAKEDINK